MKATQRLLLACAAAALCWGCTTWRAPVEPPPGLLFTHYRAPLTADVAGVPTGGKTGTASTLYVRDPIITGMGIAWADASIEAAAAEGDITKIHYADYEVLSVLGVFGQFTVRVHGE